LGRWGCCRVVPRCHPRSPGHRPPEARWERHRFRRHRQELPALGSEGSRPPRHRGCGRRSRMPAR
jgi:hypothetical protein